VYPLFFRPDLPDQFSTSRQTGYHRSVESGSKVTGVKGMCGGREWVANKIQDALAYDLDGATRVRWLILGLVPLTCQQARPRSSLTFLSRPRSSAR
jgi:hypothetical protein